MKFLTKPRNIFHHTLSMFSHYLGKFNRTPQHTGHTTMCDFSIRQRRRRSFHRIFGQWTAHHLITGTGASSNRECTSRRCTTLMNWNSICNRCGVTSTRASLTMQLRSGASVFMHVCRRMANTSSICCRKQYAYLQSTVWQHKRFIFVEYETLFDFFVVNSLNCNKFELLNFSR